MASPKPPFAASPRYPHFVLGALFVVYIVNFVDRQVLSMLVEPIKAELGVSDTYMGLLMGPAFALFYTAAGLPIARYADRGSRTLLISVGLLAWSVMTAASGLARSFGQLALARIGVGVGEASFTPASHSLISDYFPPERRATAMAIFAAGASVGAILGWLLGGYMGEYLGWRTAFLVVGLPGVALAAIFPLAVREPPRAAPPRRESLGEALRYLRTRPAFVFLAASASLHGFSSYGAASWNAVFLIRVHGLSLSETGLVLGLLSGTMSVLGQILGGRLSDRLGRRDPRWYMYYPAITSVLSLPFAVGFLLLDSFWWAVAFMMPAGALASMWTGPTYAMAQGLAKPRMRALASAIVVFLLNLVGMGLGPLAVGALNDLFEPRFGEHAVRYTLLVAAVPHTLASIFNLLAARTLRRDLEAASEP